MRIRITSRNSEDKAITSIWEIDPLTPKNRLTKQAQDIILSAFEYLDSIEIEYVKE